MLRNGIFAQFCAQFARFAAQGGAGFAGKSCDVVIIGRAALATAHIDIMAPVVLSSTDQVMREAGSYLGYRRFRRGQNAQPIASGRRRGNWSARLCQDIFQ